MKGKVKIEIKSHVYVCLLDVRSSVESSAFQRRKEARATNQTREPSSQKT